MNSKLALNLYCCGSALGSVWDRGGSVAHNPSPEASNLVVWIVSLIYFAYIKLILYAHVADEIWIRKVHLSRILAIIKF